jgi:hypothetical protein
LRAARAIDFGPRAASQIDGWGFSTGPGTTVTLVSLLKRPSKLTSLLCPNAPDDLGAFLEPRAALAAGNGEADDRYAVTLPHSDVEATVRDERDDVDRGLLGSSRTQTARAS